MEIPKNFGKISEKISDITKIPGRNFSGKFPENSGGFFWWNATVQSVNPFFYVYKK